VADGRSSSAIVASVRAHPLLIAAVILATALAGALWAATRERTYEASAQILLTPLPENGRSLPRLPLLRVSSDRTRVAQTAASLVDSPAAAAGAAQALGGDWTPDRVGAAVDVQPAGESDVLAVTASATDPALAARLANAFARAALDARDAVLAPIVSSLIADTERDLRAEDSASPVALDLAERLADLRTIGTGGDPTLSLTRDATPPSAPVGPPLWTIALLTLVAGVVVGVGSALIVDLVGPPRVADAAHAAGLTGLPVLARIPALGLLQRVGRSPVVFRPGAAAALRVLQHQLELQQGGRRLLLTGASEGDGTTSTVAELGLTLARAGCTVLLVDLNTRHPELAERLGAPPPPALGAVLAADESWQRAVVTVPRARGLTLLAIGAQGPLGLSDDVAAALPEVLTAARATHDYVLLDVPPPAESGEALQAAAAVDAAVLVLRPGHTRIADLDATLGVLGRAGRRPEGLLVIGGGGPAPTAAVPRAGGVPAGAVGGAPVTRAAGA
jgi:Mrp family chromosome partitioning ATPase